MAAQISFARAKSRLPNELNSMIIKLLPLSSLLQVAPVCFEFQLEAEVHIYKSIEMGLEWTVDDRFTVLRNALSANPRRQALVKAIDFRFHHLAAAYVVFYREALRFLLSTLPNIKKLTIIAFGDPSGSDSDIFFDTPSRFEELTIYTLHDWPRLNEFYASQPSIRRLSVLENDSESLGSWSHVLPNLEDLKCGFELVAAYVPGHPIRTLNLSYGTGTSEFLDTLPYLRLSTAPITHLRILFSFLEPTELATIADNFPALESLEVRDGGDADPTTNMADYLHWLPDSHLHPLEIFGGRTYPRFTTSYVETLFAPLARIPALQQFKYSYLYTESTDQFSVTNLLQTMKWRDTTTPQLRAIQINHMKLVKGSGGWIQIEAYPWL